jgi:hypothetical protein
MASWNSQNKRRKRKEFAKKRRIVELHSHFRDSNRQLSSKRSKRFDASIARELSEDLMDEEIDELENEFLIQKHAKSN